MIKSLLTRWLNAIILNDMTYTKADVSVKPRKSIEIIKDLGENKLKISWKGRWQCDRNHRNAWVIKLFKIACKRERNKIKLNENDVKKPWHLNC